jgi:gliding motility-associated-like protein
VTCNGGNNGTATVSVSSGTGPFNYSWSPTGGSQATATGLTAGSYTVNITDANGCATGLTITITEPAAIVLAFSSSPATCGTSNGSASVQASGGSGSYSYSWNSGSTTFNTNGLAVGNYTVIVTDASGCTNSGTVSVISPSTLVLQTTVNDVACNGGNNGSATASVSGGSAPYSYNWSSGTATAQANNLSAGTYTVTVTDADGCSSQQQAVILEPAALTVQTTTSDANCNAANGAIQSFVAGGISPYTYAWSNSGTAVGINGLAAGSYTLTVTDANGCTSFANSTVGTLPGPAISSLQTGNSACAGSTGGTALVQAQNGVGPYTYIWSNGATTALITGLLAGNYTVTVTDIFGCSATQTGTVSQPQAMVLNPVVVQNVLCFGGNDGQATASVSGGAPPFTYAWSNGSVSDTVVSLTAGTYTVTVTDFNGCTEFRQVTLVEPPALTFTLQQSTGTSCFGTSDGSASFSTGGGTAPYAYSWSNGLTSSSSIALAAGSYTVTLSDANGCTSQQSFVISEPSQIQISMAGVVNVSCYGGSNGSATAQVTGGSSPYTYLWSNNTTLQTATGLSAGSYSVVVTDGNGCTASQPVGLSQPSPINLIVNSAPTACYGDNDGTATVSAVGGTAPYSYLWNTGVITASVTGLYAGTYTVVVTDAVNCTSSASAIVTQPAAMTVVAVTPDTLCIGQSASLSVNIQGGIANYSYLWSNGATTPSLTISPSATTNYSVTITDANGCSANSGAIAQPVYPALALQLTISDDTLCLGESAVLAALASGGNGGPYTYNWISGGQTGSGSTITPNATTFYQVTVSDGCSPNPAPAQQLVVVNPLPQPDFTPPNAEGCVPVSVQFSASTVAGYAYSWNFGDNTNGTGSSPAHVYFDDGTYDVTLSVTDANGCSNSITKIGLVKAYPLPVAFFTSDPQELTLLDPDVYFSNGSTGAVSARWDFGDGSPVSTDWSPYHAYSDTGLYTIELIATSSQGCVDTFYNKVKVKGDFSFWIPNAFTPNNDLDNEYFTGYGIGIERAEFFVYDRWGNMVFMTDDLARGWDGTYFNKGDQCPEAVYVYLFRVYNGEPSPREYTGRVSLVR